MRLTRRALNGALAAGTLIGMLPAPARYGAAQTGRVPEDRIFDVLLKGKRIGQHAVTFTPEGKGFRAATTLELKVKLMFVTLLNLQHESRELWQDGRLIELASVTDDDGDIFEVVATATGDGIRVESESDSIVAPPYSRTSNTIWDPDCMLQSELIDARNGGVVGLVAERLGEEKVEVAGQEVRAVRYRGITPDADGQLWYAADQLVKVRLEVRGETGDYRLVV
jgi:Family of unknown function (DUF6134)